MSDRENSATVGAMMLVAGGVIGAGLALLFAPQSGKKTRRQIVRYSKKVRNEAEAKIQDAAHSVSDFVEDLNEKTADLLEQGSEVADDWRRHFMDAIDNGQKALEKQKKKLSQLWG